MNRRLLATLLIIVGVAAIAGILIWTFYPLYQQHVAQPPALPNQVPNPTFQVTTSTNQVPRPNQPVTTTTPVNTSEMAAQDALKRQALDSSGRLESYTNLDQFEGLRTASVSADTSFQAYLTQVRQDLIKAHPISKGSWSQTLRPLSATITSSGSLLSATQANVTVQAQMTVTDSNLDKPTVSYQQIDIQFVKQGNDWLVHRVDMKPLVL